MRASCKTVALFLSLALSAAVATAEAGTLRSENLRGGARELRWLVDGNGLDNIKADAIESLKSGLLFAVGKYFGDMDVIVPGTDVASNAAPAKACKR